MSARVPRATAPLLAFLAMVLALVAVARAQDAPAGDGDAPAPPPAQPASAPSAGFEALERGATLERIEGDIPGAETAYRAALEALPIGDPDRADALFRLGSMLARSGRFAEARAPLVELSRGYPDRRDLVARADRLLAASADPAPRVPTATATRARVMLVRRDSGTFAVDLGRADGLELGSRLTLYRGGQYTAEGLVVSLLDHVSVGKLVSGAAETGDAVDARRARPLADAGAAGRGEAGPLIDSARRLLDWAAGVGETAPRAASQSALPSAATLTATVRVFACEPALVRGLPFEFERLAPGRPDADALLPGDPGPYAALRPADERALFDLLGRDADRATSIGVRTVALEAGRRAVADLGGSARASDPASGEAARSALLDPGLHVSLRSLPLEGGGIGLEVDLICVDVGESSYHSEVGAPLPAASRVQRLRGRLELAPGRSAALLGGLRDPFQSLRGRGTSGELLVLVSIAR